LCGGGWERVCDQKDVLIAAYLFEDLAKRDFDAVNKALSNAVKKSVAQIDGMSAKELKAGLAEAQTGMGG
jgi:hypothetical protein